MGASADGEGEVSAPAAGGGSGGVTTVVLRASTDNLLDDLERAIDDGVNAYKVRTVLVLTAFTVSACEMLQQGPQALGCGLDS